VVLKRDITVSVVERLVASQFPEWAALPVAPVELDGWDNATFRLGDAMSVRLPSADPYVAQIDKEHRWLPVLAPHLPAAIPMPLAKGEPSEEFPRPWSVYRWIDGKTPTGDDLPDQAGLTTLAAELGHFLTALYRCEPSGPPPGAHSFSRGGPVHVWDAQVRELVARLDGRSWWESLKARILDPLDARHDGPAVWVHGDVTGSNLLVRDAHLIGVIDFGCSAVGDPACDLTIAWTMFDGESRDRLQAGIEVESSAWIRARGWALWKALIHLDAGSGRPGRTERRDQRAGWRFSAAEIVGALVTR